MGNCCAKPLISVASEKIGYKWCGGGLSAGRFYKSNAELPTRDEYLFNIHESIPLNRVDASCVIHDILYSIAAKLTVETIEQFVNLVRKRFLVTPNVPFFKYFIRQLEGVTTYTLKDIVRMIAIAADKELVYHMDYINKLPSKQRKTKSEKLVANIIIIGFWGKRKLGNLSVANNHGSFISNEFGISSELNGMFNLYTDSYTSFKGILYSDKSIPPKTCINRNRKDECSHNKGILFSSL